ncbi:MAG: TRAP transporter permease [Paracoccus sp. (in: a-proteobacteria)]|uniref:TRAP transporter permease n=1 Tax=Paracoccus sp. TaxID=267 RepID=UPI002E86DE63|nr:TRAP transporter fused permease subunit [Pseudomonadota bacterium]
MSSKIPPAASPAGELPAMPTAGNGLADRISAVLGALVPLLALVWVLRLPMRASMLVFPEQIAAVMLTVSMAAIYLRTRGRAGFPAVCDIGLALVALGVGAWVYARFQVLSEMAAFHPTEALILGAFVVVLVMDVLRRVVGWTLVVIFGLFFAYALWGNHVPGALSGRAIALPQVLRFLGSDSSATWGASLQVGAFVVAVFVLFGGFLIAVGGGDFFTQLSMRVAGKGPGGAAKIAVTASGLFGSVSGSAVSNVMSTGVVTIQMMRRSGITARQAGAIEAVASTGGQLMPPIMGAAAFLMAEIVQVPYRDVLVAALLPALLYYLSIFLQIDFLSRRDGVGTLRGERRVAMGRVLAQGWTPILGFISLLAGIFWLNLQAQLAATWTIFVLLGAALIAHLVRPGLPGSISPRKAWEALATTGMATAEVLLVTAAAGMIVGILSVTGLGFSLSMVLLDLGGASLLGMLVVTAFVAIVLGLGLPTTAVYLLLASLAAPALVQMGIPPLAAHMFVFYFGMLSMITPPIALASFAAATISGAGQVETAVESFKVGWVAYLLPFLFIYKPALLMEGNLPEIVYVAVSSVIALALVCGGWMGHGFVPVRGALRVAWVAVGVLTILPLMQIGGRALEYGIAAIGLGLVLHHLGLTRRTATAPA